MPTYDYRCNSCEKKFAIFHEIGKDCELCCECDGELVRDYSNVNTTRSSVVSTKDIDDKINEAMSGLATTKKEMKGKRDDL